MTRATVPLGSRISTRHHHQRQRRGQRPHHRQLLRLAHVRAERAGAEHQAAEEQERHHEERQRQRRARATACRRATTSASAPRRGRSTNSMASQTAICSRPAAPRPSELAGQDLVRVGRRQQHLDHLVLLLGGGALHQIARGHQHRHQEQHREDQRQRERARSTRPGRRRVTSPVRVTANRRVSGMRRRGSARAAAGVEAPLDQPLAQQIAERAARVGPRDIDRVGRVGLDAAPRACSPAGARSSLSGRARRARRAPRPRSRTDGTRSSIGGDRAIERLRSGRPPRASCRSSSGICGGCRRVTSPSRRSTPGSSTTPYTVGARLLFLPA